MLAGHFDHVCGMAEAGVDMDVVEDADTLIGNSRKKARAVFDVLADGLDRGDGVLADDTGLLVDALGGAPGVRSARYAGEGHDDAANRKKLLDALAGVPDEARTAHFATAMVLIRKGCDDIEATGRVFGTIIREERGEQGFGYDSLFYYEPMKKTFAEMDLSEKNAVSHRRNALMLVLAALKAEV